MGEFDTTPDGAPLFDKTEHGDAASNATREGDVLDEGLSFRYVERTPRRLRIAPSHGEITNTVVVDPWPSPTACVRLDNERFAFDSSFPHATMSGDLARLQSLRAIGSDQEKIAIFGHADPTGTDAYNKTLSGRRAKAIYGLLIRSPETWDQLHQQPFEGDHWGIASLHACLCHLGYDPGADDQRATPAYHAAMNAFETDHGLPQTMGRRTRLELFGAYMDSLMGASPGDPRAYAKEDFVGEGKDPELRGAFQGCGERNPAMVVSKEEDTDLAKAKNHARRNKVQAANRRVLIFLYAKDDVKDMSRWECPSAKAGPSACDKVAWSNKEDRLAPGGKRREVRRGGKTFGCKFYDFTARISPCEALRGTVRLWIRNEHGLKYDGPVDYVLRAPGFLRHGTTDGDGYLEEENVPTQQSVDVAWLRAPVRRRTPNHPEFVASPPAEDPRSSFVHTSHVFLPFEEEESHRRARHWLRNLSYEPRADDISHSLIQFAVDYGLPAESSTADQMALLEEVHRTGREAVARDERVDARGAPPTVAGGATKPGGQVSASVRPTVVSFQLRLIDRDGEPMRHVACDVDGLKRMILDGVKSDDQGILSLSVPKEKPLFLTIHAFEKEEPEHLMTLRLDVEEYSDSDVAATRARLNNLGYLPLADADPLDASPDPALQRSLDRFRWANEIVDERCLPVGTLSPVDATTAERLRDAHDSPTGALVKRK